MYVIHDCAFGDFPCYFLFGCKERFKLLPVFDNPGGIVLFFYTVDDDFGYIPRGNNGALRHGVLYNAKWRLSYFCISTGCPLHSHPNKKRQGIVLCVIQKTVLPNDVRDGAVVPYK